MTNAEEFFAHFELVAGLAALVVVLRFMLFATFVEEHRQDIFGLRRDLFLIMARGHVAPNSDAYVYLRSVMNGALRHAERFTFLRSLLLVMALGTAVRPQRQAWAGRLAEIGSVATKRELVAIDRRFGSITAKHLVKTSPILWLLGSAVVVLMPESLIFSCWFLNLI